MRRLLNKRILKNLKQVLLNRFYVLHSNTFGLEVNNKPLDLANPLVMGVINLSSESATSAGRFPDNFLAVEHALQLVEEGADILDIGAEATNPKVYQFSNTEQQLEKLIPFLKSIRQKIQIPISIDTSSPEVMQVVADLGADMINDVRALQMPGALEMAAKLNLPICLMHMRYPFGQSAAKELPAFNSVINEIKQFFVDRLKRCEQVGIAREKIILDPGVGHGNFGKNTTENLAIIRDLKQIKDFNLPILIGVSRKTFIGELLNQTPDERLFGSLACALIAVQNGANIVRVHDVKATKDVLKMLCAVE